MKGRPGTAVAASVAALRKEGVSVRRGRSFALAFVVALIAAGAGHVGAAAADTSVAGTISSDTTWTASGSPYVLTDTAKVASGVTLTIDAGVTVEFAGGQGTQLVINGDILTRGTASSRVVFTSSQDVQQAQGAPGQYYGISIYSGDAKSSFSYTTFKYGGYGSGGYYAYAELNAESGSVVSIDHSTFEDNQYSGLSVGNGGANVSYSLFQANGDGISMVGSSSAAVTVSHTTLADNVQDGFFADSTTANGASFWFDTITGNGSAGIEVEEGCGNSLSNYPHGEYNNIYANNPGGGANHQLEETGTLSGCAALAVDWRNNYWGSGVYFWGNPSGCNAVAGHLAFSSDGGNPPSGPINDRTWYANGQCAEDSFYVGPGQFLTSLINNDDPEPAGSNLYGPPGDPAFPGLKSVQCGDPVNCLTGNFTETRTDLSVPGWNGGLQLTRTYNSLAAAGAGSPGPFGWGWSFSYGASLNVDPSSQAVTVTEGDGATVDFLPAGDGTYLAAPWVQATLVKNSDGTFTFTLPTQQAMSFDGSGRLASLADPDGNTTTLSYNGSGQLITVTDPSGRTLTFVYTGGEISQVIDPAGGAVTYGYDSSGNLTSATDADGNVSTFGYDASHQLTTMTDPRGGAVTNTYDSAGRVIKQVDPLGRTRTWAYAANETQVTNPRGDVTDLQFTSNLPTKVTHAYGTATAATTTYTYDDADNLASKTDPNNHTWTYAYDGAGDLTSVDDPLGRTTNYTYDGKRNLLTATLPSGRQTTYGYDAHSNATSITRAPTGSGQQAITMLGYDSHGDLTSRTDPRGQTRTYGYDSHGDLSTTTDPLGNQTTYAYDADGRRTSIVSPRGNVSGANPASFTTAYVYDPLSRVVQETDPLGHSQTWTYDGDGNAVSHTDAKNNTTTYSYDADNEATATTRPDSTTLTSAYDAAGNLTSQTDASGHTTSYTYDTLQRRASVTDPLSHTTSYGYDAAGNRTGLTDPAGRMTSYGYDAANELTSISYSDGTTPAVSYGYDADGRRSTMTDGTGSTSYGYDGLGRLASTTDGAGNTIGYGHDLAGNVTSLTYPNGKTVTRTFDADGHLTDVSDWLGKTTSFGYGPDSNLKSTTFPAATGDLDTYTYDNADHIDGIQMTQGSTTLASLAYTRDPSNQLATDIETGLPEPPVSTARDYGYDNADNLTKLDGAGGYAYNQANELTSSPGATYSYDSLGERTSASPTDGSAGPGYTYDQAGRLTSYTPASGSATTYGYNGDGLRTSKTSGGNSSNFTWDLTATLPLTLTDETNSYIYGPDGQPIEQINQSGTPSYLHEDQLGSVRLVTDQNGNLTGSFSYNSYGALTISTGTATTPFGYAGQYTDPESGLVYMRARYYDPTTGQFLTQDPLEAVTQQPYSYADDNPINENDPSGLCGSLSSWGSFWSNCGSNAASGVASGAEAAGTFVAKNWRPIVSAAATVGTTVGCAAQPEACGILIGANTAAQSALVATGPGSTASKAGLIAVNLLSAGAAGGSAGASEILRAAEQGGEDIPRWVNPFVTATGAAPWLGLAAAQLATYPWITC